MLLELCVIELEDVALNNNILLTSPQPVIQESAHPYSKQMTTTGVVRIPGKFFFFNSLLIIMVQDILTQLFVI